MSIALHSLKSNAGAKKKRKTIGRGNASGHGTYSTKGMKGQKARSGGSSGLKQKGWRHILLSMPKLRGFKSMYAKNEAISLNILEKNFQSGDNVNRNTLFAKKLISQPRARVKILGTGELTKKLDISGCLVTNSAKEKITKVGGKIS